MPPLKTYIFKHLGNDLIILEIRAYRETLAHDILNQTVKTPEHFKLF